MQILQKGFAPINYSASSKHKREKQKPFETQDDETCSSCYKVFATKYVRKKHEQETHKERKQKCVICSRSFRSKISLEYHTQTYHDSSMLTFKCSVCEKILSTQQILKRHIQTVQEKQTFECDKCGKKFHKKKLLQETSQRSSFNRAQVKPSLCYSRVPL